MVIRVATVYLVTGWLIIQVAAATFPSFGIPDWAFRFVTLVVLLGLPVALIITWAFELTPDGIKVSKSAAAKSPANENKTLTNKRNWQAYAFGALLPTLIFGTLALFFYIQTQNSGAELNDDIAGIKAEGEERALSIAVMPLVNMSSHEENAYFAGGIHEDVLTNLSRINNLQVISRTSMLRYASSELTLPEIGKELGVDYIVEGSVRRISNHVRVTVQLINARNDLHLWANNFERELVDVFATQSELAKEISNSLHLELQPNSVGTLEGMPTFSVKAYDLYISAANLEKTEGETEEIMKRRREMLEEAVIVDPDFVEAWAVLKRVYDRQLKQIGSQGWFVNEEDQNTLVERLSAKSKRALDKAIALGPKNIETLLSRVVDHAWPKSYEEMQAQKTIFDQIITTYPDNAKARYHLGWWHSHQRDLPQYNHDDALAKAAAAFEEALKLDPFNARMVGAVLKWYRDRGYQEDVTRLVARLNQIVPETAADRSLARVSWYGKRNRITATFLKTADESSFIEEYETGLKNAIESNDFNNIVVSNWDKLELASVINDEDRLIALYDIPIDMNKNGWNQAVFSHINLTLMNVFLNRGDLQQARHVAQKILDHEKILLREAANECGCIATAITLAHVTLGNIDEARRLAEELVEENFSFAFQPWGIIAMTHVDTERAVEAAFEWLAKYPEWPGFDEIAAFHIPGRPFLTHPKVQEYYLNEGKWINYLSARVPEYAKYKP